MIQTRTCQHCYRPLSPFARADSRYCSGRCRVAAHRVRHAGASPLPAALRARDRWVRHDAAKRPLTTQGRGASSTNVRTWSTFGAASAASTVGDGLGFVLNGDGIVCLDLDRCITGNVVAPWAAAILSSCPDTYIERSPGGHGLHVWGTCELDKGRIVQVDGGRVEIYGNGRYLTITGQTFAGAPATLADLTAFIATL